MKYERVFPFDLIERGAKIILYGAGKLGKQYWEQVTACHWCDIICVVDKNYYSICGFPIDVSSPECIKREKVYDYIVVAVISQSNREKICYDLLERGIPQSKIVSDVNQFYAHNRIKKVSHEIDNMNETEISIAFCPMGTLGDYIISLKFYQELVKYIKKAMIDIYAVNILFARCVFTNLPFLGIVSGESWESFNNYDLVIEVGIRINVVFLDDKRLQTLAPELFKKIDCLQRVNQLEFSYYPAHSLYTSRMMVEQGKFLGQNRYTAYSCGEIFDIKDNVVKLYVRESAEQDYIKLNLGKKYITFNYGADRYSGRGKPMNKMWPKEYHIKLNQLLKDKYPDIEIVQLGAGDIEEISGADRHIMGEDLEIVKVILRNALCHIDCEGGLVHMATQLGTKCVVLFGPTPSWFFGYNQNINIVAEKCKECAYLFPDWKIKCHKYDRPECMYSIIPEVVLEKISDYLDNLSKL